MSCKFLHQIAGKVTLDSSGVAICNGSSSIAAYVSMGNSAIAARSTYIFKFNALSPATGWEEIYAQSLAYEAYAFSVPVSNTFQYPANYLFHKNTDLFMKCSLEWAHGVLGTAKVDANSCATGAPQWYLNVLVPPLGP